jgi:putative flavoprotein involved in K+ transport
LGKSGDLERIVSEHHDIVVIGGGQAGLAMSAVLQSHSLDHVVLERRKVGERWRTERWDSLRFQFPNWSLALPGYAYVGDDPDGFAHFSEILSMIEGYARHTHAPVREGVEVMALHTAPVGGGFVLTTSIGTISARRVVVATGPFQRPHIPLLSDDVPRSVHQTDPTRYRSPAQLPDGGVLVVGSGASGFQIADELNAAGREVVLSVSRHRRAPRRFRGRDLYWWMDKLGRFAQTVESFPGREWPPSTVVTGINGGYDVDVRALARRGVRVAGHTVAIGDGTVRFDDDADRILDEADQAYTAFIIAASDRADRDLADLVVGAERPDLAAGGVTPAPVPAIESLSFEQDNIGTIVWATGYANDYDWIRVPVFDDRGRPVHERGVSSVDGLFFLGLHWMHTFRSGLLSGVGADAEHLASVIGGTAS